MSTTYITREILEIEWPGSEEFKTEKESTFA